METAHPTTITYLVTEGYGPGDLVTDAHGNEWHMVDADTDADPETDPAKWVDECGFGPGYYAVLDSEGRMVAQAEVQPR